MKQEHGAESAHERWFEQAVLVARGGLCLRAQCGSVIVRNGEVVGRGHNGPPRDDVSHRRCADAAYDRMKKPKYDLTCCVHAEWRAIMDALVHEKGELEGSALYYVRLDETGKRKPSRNPFCTVCSRLALDTGISVFALWHEEGITLYDTVMYNERSYAFHR
jgi:deoxycytidylate deaminase